MKTRSRLLILFCALACAAPLFAADWPQRRGPDRTGISKETGLLQSWPQGGPKLLWTYKSTGLGFSSCSVVGDRLYTLGARGDSTDVLALDVKTGQEVWHTKIGPMFTFKTNTWGDGPRSTPTVDGSLLFALGGFGDLVCLESATGKEVWRLNLAKDLDGELMSEWGYSESPLVDGDKLVCTPGGAKGAVVALDKKTGKLLWRSKDLTDKATYSSLQAADIHGVRQYVALTYISNAQGSAIAGVAADDGRLLWHQPFYKSQVYAVASTPIVLGNQVYVSAGEGAGCRLLDITPDGAGKFKATNLYTITKIQKGLQSYHGGVVALDKYVYGQTKRLGWVCQDIKSGKLLWEEEGQKLPCESGALIAADGRLYLYSDEGVAVLLVPSPKGWEETGRFELPEKSKVPETRSTSSAARIWTHPTVANGRLYLRDQELLFCYDIRAAK